MKTKTRLLLALLLALALASSSVVVVGKEARHEKRKPCHFPAIYNFGDSNSDTGASSAAFYPAKLPSGETFFGRAVGRGCDGRLVIDFIAKHLGLPYLSPYLDSIGTNFRHGANFAVGGATIRPQNESMSLNGVPPFSLDIQVEQFINFRTRTRWLYQHGKRRLRRSLPRAEEFSKALYVVDIGQNDIAAGFRSMTNNQLLSQIPDIVNQFGRAIQKLYDEGGAREFWIHNTGPIGCLAVTLHYLHNPDPSYVDRYGCVKKDNDMATEFNTQLKAKINHLRDNLTRASFTLVDIYSAKYTLVTNAIREGFLDKAKICCGYHEDNGHVWCGNKANISGAEIYAGSCDHPSLYVSWDGVHYTEAANRWIADRIVRGGSFSDPPHLPLTHACLPT